eukprot:6085799-Heterocapsa_arctica.AAC.1
MSDIAFTQVLLPAGVPPAMGYHYAFDARALMLTEVVRVVIDSGAEAATMSTACATRLLRAQGLPTGDNRRALTGMARYPRPQKLYGYRDTEP